MLLMIVPTMSNGNGHVRGVVGPCVAQTTDRQKS